MPRSKSCPVCGIENTGGAVHVWHKWYAKTRRHTVSELADLAQQTIEKNAIKEMLCDAIEIARQPDDWTAPKRRQYHRHYYRRNIGKRRQQRKVSKAMQRRMRPIIAEFCKAVDIGRLTATW